MPQMLTTVANVAPAAGLSVVQDGSIDVYALASDGSGGFVGTKINPPVPVVHTAATDPIVLTSPEGMTVVNKTAGAATEIDLPAAPLLGEMHTVIDAKGDANTNNITVDGNGKTINGAANVVMDVDYQALAFVYTGTEWNQLPLSDATGANLIASIEAAEGAEIVFADELGAQMTPVASGVAPILQIRQTVGHADLTAGAPSEELAITGFPANARKRAAWIEKDVDFSGGTVSALTAEIGDTGDTTELMTAGDVFTGAGAGHLVNDGSAGGAAGGGFEAAYSPVIKFIATGDNVVNLDAGSLVAIVEYQPLTLASP